MREADACKHAVLTVEEMGRADRAAMARGVASESLMAAAGKAVADAIIARTGKLRTLVLCGPGNNGGDGFVAARCLREAGWHVRVALLGERHKLKGDAAFHARQWAEPVEPLGTPVLEGAELFVDALFGAGLARPLEGIAKETVDALNAQRRPVVAVDVPSGLHGDTGIVLGAAPRAILTVTFFRKKPAHLLLPGRILCGEVAVAEIGIPAEVLDQIKPACFVNHPDLWLADYRWPTLLDHKYRRGHGLVVAGGRMTGAAKLAARGALRIGAGLVTVASPPEAEPIFQSAMAGLLTEPFGELEAFKQILESRRKNAYLLGPGNETSAGTRSRVLAALATGRPCVLDAAALSSFEGAPDALFSAIGGPCVMTPHEGEFARIFDLKGDKLSRARAAARRSGAVILLKGGDSVIAAPDGMALIQDNAPPELGTAGTGDVLAGFVLGLLAQGMPTFEAAGAALWLHAEAAAAVGPGLIAEDLPDTLPAVLQRLKSIALRDRPQDFGPSWSGS
jgi:NAD(P)H-hydrate epimerase